MMKVEREVAVIMAKPYVVGCDDDDDVPAILQAFQREQSIEEGSPPLLSLSRSSSHFSQEVSSSSNSHDSVKFDRQEQIVAVVRAAVIVVTRPNFIHGATKEEGG